MSHNKLIDEKSPYLHQHAHNPVAWYPWSEEALQLAKTSNKPIFLSIGYATCHWCHVMAHESFEDKETAALMNRHFINIKVDREERPDLDAIYMHAVQMLTGSGGWPMSVWLTPELKPFYGGTYFPPADRYGRPGFPTVLEQLAALWEKERERVVGSAAEIAKAIEDAVTAPSTLLKAPSFEEAAEAAFAQLKNSYDKTHGGFGPAPKFPMPTYLNFLLNYYARSGHEEALHMASFTMKQMIKGGLYDQLGGGFARYSTDVQWIVPHFEKMLYDNSQLITVLSALVQITGDDFFATALKESLAYIERDLTISEGAFASAEDADSEGKEGAFYVWTLAQIKEVLGNDSGELWAHHYGVSVTGNFFDPHTQESGLNVLVRAHENTDAQLQAAKEKLFLARSKRPRPQRDDKVITEWNGLMISALVHAARALGGSSYILRAEKAARFIENALIDPVSGLLYRRWRGGERKIEGHQADYAFFIQALLDLFELRGDPHWLSLALDLQEKHDQLFWDDKAKGYFSTVNQKDLLFRFKDKMDNVTPSGNSCALRNAARLGHLLNRPDLLSKAEQTIAAFASELSRYPTGLTSFLSGYELWARGHRQIVIVGPHDRPDTQELKQTVYRFFLPNTTFILIEPGSTQNKLANMLPFTAGLKMIDEKATAYVCENYACQNPTNNVETLKKLLRGKNG